MHHKISWRAALWAAVWLPAMALAQQQPPQQPPQELSLEQALAQAVQHSQAVQAGRAAASSAAELIPAAGRLPDPQLRLGLDNLPISGPARFDTGGDFMTMKRIAISQEWPSAHKRAVREDAARALARREGLMAGMAAAEVRLQLAATWLDAWHAQAALRLSRQHEHHLRQELATAHARQAAAAGGSSADAVLGLAAAQGQAEDETAELAQALDQAQLALQRWLGRRPEALSSAVPAFDQPAEPDFVQRHPTVLRAERELALARQLAELARSERRANWGWELGYAQRSGHPDMVSIGVSIPLQLSQARGQDRELASRLALADKAEADLGEARRSATAEFQALAAEAARLQQRLDRYRSTVLAPAGQRIAAALAAYRGGQAPLMALFEARNAELAAQRHALTLQRDLAKAQARLALQPLTQGDAR